MLSVNPAAGTIGASFDIPWPAEDRQLISQSSAAGSIRFYQQADGRFRFELSERTENGERIIDSVTTTPVEPDGLVAAVLIAWWENRLIVGITINQTTVYSRDLPFDPSKTNIISSTPNPYSPNDYSTLNKLARQNRQDRLNNWVPKPNRTHGGEEYAFSSLVDEALQLRDLLGMIDKGRIHHAIGISSRIRLLTIGHPMGLLQLCAAYLRMPLIMYTSPTHKFPYIKGQSRQLWFAASPKPSRWYSNPIDFDVWLDLRAMVQERKEFTNLDLIGEIGNTIGSHRDIDIRDSVEFLMSGKIWDPVESDNVIRYLRIVGSIVFSLSQDVLGPVGLSID